MTNLKAKKIKRFVHHVNQDTFEYWEHTSLHGWRYVPRSKGENWKLGSYDYIDLRHNMKKGKNGHYGPYEIG